MKNINLKNSSAGLVASLLLTGCVANWNAIANKEAIETSHTKNQPAIELKKIATLKNGNQNSNKGFSYSANTKRLFIANGESNSIDIVDISDPQSPKIVKSINLNVYGTGVNSIDFSNGYENSKGYFAVAVPTGDVKGKNQNRGCVLIFDQDGNIEKMIRVGYMPKMLAFNDQGTKIVVANEGEPSSDYRFDPIGSVGIIDVLTGAYQEVYFNDVKQLPSVDGLRVRLGATPSSKIENYHFTQDLEPEFVAIAGDFAYISLAENNAIARLDINQAKLEMIQSLGSKRLQLNQNSVDGTKTDLNLSALYQPGNLEAVQLNHQFFLVSANQAASRNYQSLGDGSNKNDCAATGGVWQNSICSIIHHQDAIKLSNVKLNETIKNNQLNQKELLIIKDMGDENRDGSYESIYTFGGNSFSLWDQDGNLIWDSGNEIREQVKAHQSRGHIDLEQKAMRKENGNLIDASPRALEVAQIGKEHYIFLGLYQQNALLSYQFDHAQPSLINYLKPDGGDNAPIAIEFINANQSPNGKHLLIVAYDLSGTTTIYEVKGLMK